MVVPIRSPTGEVGARQTGISAPRARRKFRQYRRMLRPLNNRLNPALSRKVSKRRVSACLKAVQSVPINGVFIDARQKRCKFPELLKMSNGTV